MEFQQTTIRAGGQLLDFSTPKIMGILNTTPDSFFEKSRVSTEEKIVTTAEKMLSEGATILDIGGQSTRPNSTQVPENEELRRVAPAIEAILKRFPEVVISIDTYRASVARAAVEAGAAIVNDISAGRFDEAMFSEIARLGVPYILMHQPHFSHETMHRRVENACIEQDVLDFFIEKISRLRVLGVVDLVVDAGFGFGKTVENNYRLLRNLHVLRLLGVPILAGVSRKSMIWKTLEITPDDALNGTTALNMVALLEGASILRVHDVRAAMETIQLFEMLKNSSK